MLTRSYHIAVASVTLALASCGGDALPETIERDTFVQAYANLRIAAVETDSGRIAFTVRDSILDGFGVTEEDLMTFADGTPSSCSWIAATRPTDPHVSRPHPIRCRS
jgi:hypothetical protein